MGGKFPWAENRETLISVPAPASLPAVPPVTGFAALPAPHLHTRKGKIQGVRGRTFHGPMGTGRGFV